MSLARRTADGFTAFSMPDRSTASLRGERRAIKRSLGIPISILDFAPAGTTVWDAAFAEAFPEVGVAADKRLHLPAGNYDLAAELEMAYPVDLFGDGMSFSVLRPTHLGNGLVITGEFGTGPRVRDLTIGFATAGGLSSAHILVQNYQDPGTPTIHYSPDFLELSGLNLTGYGGSRVNYNAVLNGNPRVNDVGGTVPIGLRNISMRNIVGFNAVTRGFDIRHVRVGYYEQVNRYGGVGGGTDGAAISAIGAICFDNKFFGCTINGIFGISNSDRAELHGVTTTPSLGAGVTNYVNTDSLLV